MWPGVSIAAVALHHRLNTNMLRKWLVDAEHKAPPKTAKPAEEPEDHDSIRPTFVPLALTAPAVEGYICIELQRGGTTVSIAFPAASAREYAAWFQELLR